MKKPLIFLIALAVLFLFNSGANNAYASQKVIYKGARPEKGIRKEKEKTAQTGKTEHLRESEYFYNPKNKTDPFSPFILKRARSFSQITKKDVASQQQLKKMLALLQDMKKPQTELQKIKIANLTLTSIIKSKGRTFAMVKGPKSAKGYLLKKGTAIGTNGGVVEKIVSEEKKTDMGKQITRKVIIKEPYLDRDGKLKYKSVEMKMAGSSTYN